MTKFTATETLAKRLRAIEKTLAAIQLMVNQTATAVSELKNAVEETSK